MHQNALLIEEVTAFIRDFEHGSQLEKNHEIIELIDKICEHENQHGIGTIEEQTDWVLCLVGCSHNDILEKRNAGIYIFRHWAMRTASPLGITYVVGFMQGRLNQIAKAKFRLKLAAKKPNIGAAIQGRRLIGANSREKVRVQASIWKHLSKESAAAEISDAIGLSSGTVRRYLSELFPGDDWKKL